MDKIVHVFTVNLVTSVQKLVKIFHMYNFQILSTVLIGLVHKSPFYFSKTIETTNKMSKEHFEINFFCVSSVIS